MKGSTCLPIAEHPVLGPIDCEASYLSYIRAPSTLVKDTAAVPPWHSFAEESSCFP